MRSLELFAGAGGLGMGLEAAGFHPADVVEWNRYCCETLRANRDRHASGVNGWKRITEADIRNVKFDGLLGRVDLVSGGPPCQPFSLAGKHRGEEDMRDMFPHAIRAIRQCQPKAFIFENVKGLTRATFGNYFQYIKLQMEHPTVVLGPDETWLEHLGRLEAVHLSGAREELHYRVVARVLNAASFGVPQRRERVFFVGFRDDLSTEWSFPTETHSLDALLWDQLHGDYWDRHALRRPENPLPRKWRARGALLNERPEGRAWETVRDALQGLPEPKPSADPRIPNHGYQGGARSYPGHTGSHLDEPGKTLKAGVHGVPGGENMLLRPDGSVRYFTVRESARLQTFDDDFVFLGSWSEAMRQLGNAVPVKLARAVGVSVAEGLARAA